MRSLALLLAAVGVYGLISFSVSQRTAEMGVRMALGASPGQVGALVMRQGPAARRVWRRARPGRWRRPPAALIAGLLFETSATDPRLYAALGTLLLTIAALACYVPARRAMRVDPMRALRAD